MRQRKNVEISDHGIRGWHDHSNGQFAFGGSFEPGSNLITEISGNGNYEADRPEGYDFNVGDVYTATAFDIEFELKVKEVDDKKLVFEPVSDMSAVSDAQIFPWK